MSKRDLAMLRKATPAELVAAHSRAMLEIEMIWRIAAETLDAQAGDDRLCKCAVGAGKARAMMYRAQAFHADADVMAAEYGSLMPEGSDVPMPAFGGR